MQSEFDLTSNQMTYRSIYKKCVEACHFISLDVSMSCCTIFKMHDVYSVCFVITDLRSLTITCIIYTHVPQMSCM